jgi:hypothetical protein
MKVALKLALFRQYWPTVAGPKMYAPKYAVYKPIVRAMLSEVIFETWLLRLFQRPCENPVMKKSTEIIAQYLIESLVLARSILLGALRWMKPK